MELTSPTGDSSVETTARVDEPANRPVRQTQFELPPTPPRQFAPPKPQPAPEPELEPQPAANAPAQTPPGLASPGLAAPRQADPDFFNNPFGDDDPPAAPKGAVPQAAAPQAVAPQAVAPRDVAPRENVAPSVDSISLPSPLEAPAVPSAPATPIDTPDLSVQAPQTEQPEPALPPNVLREAAPAPQPKPEPKVPELVPVPAPRALPESSRVVPIDPTADAPARTIPDPKPAALPEPSLRVPPGLDPPTQPRRPVEDGFDPDPADVPLFQDLPGGQRAPGAPSEPGAVDRADDDRIRREVEEFDRRSREGKSDKPDFPERSLKGESSDVKQASFSCDDFRKGIAAATIRNVSLDISPPFRPDIIEKDEFDKLRNRFKEKQKIRDWTSANGKKLGRGRLHDLAYEKVLVESEFGTIEELPVSELSEVDLTYITSQWGLPQECLIEQQEYVPRNWIPSKVTWKASNLVHKPLYFEEVNLERYGQTVGPVLEPVISSAHFFANIAVLPYKMGVHLPYECQYPLGYYRPGDCAPWIIPPVPLSLRGAIFQAGAVAGTFWAIP
jgi:hypothetical protein